MGQTDYDTYTMNRREFLFYMVLCAAFIYTAAFIFYRNHIFCIILCPLSVLYPGFKKRQLIKKRKEELNLQFKDMLYSLSSTLSAGRPVETAFREVLRDLAIIYPDPKTSIIREVGAIVRKVEMNETVESALADFAERSHLEDIWNFADVFRICKRTGGNLIEVIRNTSGIINDKIEIKQEINTILAQRRFERKVLNVLPVLLLVLISFTAGEYIRPVFETLPGRLASTAAVLLLVCAYFISGRIMDIKI